MQVQQVMHVGEKIPIVSAQTKMSDVLVVMTSKGFGCAVVADDDNKLLGIITDGDLRRHMEDDLVNRTASQVMSAKPQTIHPTMLIANALEFMYKRSITVSIIVDLDDKVQGVLHIHDCL
jgi:arabinose-5-phosphate isomerase